MTLLKKDPSIKTVAAIYGGFQLFLSLLLWVPVFYIIQKQMGLVDTEIFGIQSFYYMAFFILEIPTGLISDKIGHKNALRLGALILMVANFCPIFLSGYSSFLTHFMLIAVSRSLVSGAASAYLYDFLKTKGAVSEYKKFEGRARAWGLLARVITWPFAGTLVSIDPTIVYWLSGLNSAIAFLCATGLTTLTVAPATKPKASYKNEFLFIAKVFKTSPLLVLLMLQGAGIFVLQRICMVQLFGPLLENQNVSIQNFGLVMSAMTLMEAMGASKSHKLKMFIKDYTAIFILTLCMAACFWVMAQSQLVAIVALGLFSLCCGMAFPIQKQLLNDSISDSNYRATVLSIESILDRIICAVAIMFIGPLIASKQLSAVLEYSALITCAVIVIVFVPIYIKRGSFNKKDTLAFDNL
ncbi:MAG: MFS transporter [Bacteriovoracaceae bacterium]|nr:MFS transporter [Bacteriovoracaceae bacterium]